MIPKTVRRAVIDRAQSQCERCGQWCDTDAGYYSLQHRRGRGSGGSRAADTNTATNLALMCGSATTLCHGWVENHPLEALEDGWRVRQGDDPSAAPILHWELGRVYLTRGYGYEAAA
jgi:hypothetical protein